MSGCHNAIHGVWGATANIEQYAAFTTVLEPMTNHQATTAIRRQTTTATPATTDTEKTVGTDMAQ